MELDILKKGFPKTAIHRQRIGLSSKGRVCHWKGKPRPELRGSNNGNWTGKSSENVLERKRIEIKLWKRSVLERDNFTCTRCGKHGVEFNVHHIKPFAKFPELRTSISNGMTLCIECHKIVHKEARNQSCNNF